MSNFWVVAVCVGMAVTVAATSGPLSPGNYVSPSEAARVVAATGDLRFGEPLVGPSYEFDGGLCFGGHLITVSYPGTVYASDEVHIAFNGGCDTQAARNAPSPSEADFLHAVDVQISDELDFYGRCVLGAETNWTVCMEYPMLDGLRVRNPLANESPLLFAADTIVVGNYTPVFVRQDAGQTWLPNDAVHLCQTAGLRPSLYVAQSRAEMAELHKRVPELECVAGGPPEFVSVWDDDQHGAAWSPKTPAHTNRRFIGEFTGWGIMSAIAAFFLWALTQPEVS